jgi:hypothetical protein
MMYQNLLVVNTKSASGQNALARALGTHLQKLEYVVFCRSPRAVAVVVATRATRYAVQKSELGRARRGRAQATPNRLG